MATESAKPAQTLRLRMAIASRAVGKPQYVLEKDYALSYLIAGIAAVPALRETLVFKGGTCLRKMYFPGYRFSEDLDFTSVVPWDSSELIGYVARAADEMKEMLLAFGPFEGTVATERHREAHPRGQFVFRVRVRFPWMRGADCSLKVEVSVQEPLLAGPVERNLIHEFSGETLKATIGAYRLEEIAAEKLRAFLQSRQHLRERGWLRNRPRDLYDLWRLWHQNDVPLDWQEVGRILPAKAEAYGLTFTAPADFLDDQVVEGIRRDWQAQLADFVTDLPSFEQCIAVLPILLSETIS